ncbi:MAG: DUF2225 domain-containing protein [Spirochaetia bacterium]|nr:DUF2225 domain-containing protein [Spirochaetia bacterium]
MLKAAAKDTSNKKAISYRLKDKTQCKVCNFEFQREQLHSGGGRLIAGKLTAELRRLYDLNKKFGKVYPLAYAMVVCPQCLFASFPNDFNMLGPDEIERLKRTVMDRRTGIEKIVGPVDFNEDRNLVLGAASYVLAIDCYQLRNSGVAPTPKKAISSIRGAWLFGDMHEEFPTMNFDKIRDFLYQKAVFYYSPTLDIMSTGKEPVEQFQNLLGPDTDNNWAFDGVIYLNGYLTRRFLDQLAPTKEKKIEVLDRCKRYLGKLYGMGKASKSKPSVIIDMAKDLYEVLSNQLDELMGVTPAAPGPTK